VNSDGSLVVSDFSLRVLFRVDSTNGNRTIMSGNGVGTGPTFEAPLGLAVQGTGSIAVGDAGLERVLQVDPNTGNRTVL
jgi:hypothetical protein